MVDGEGVPGLFDDVAVDARRIASRKGGDYGIGVVEGGGLVDFNPYVDLVRGDVAEVGFEGVEMVSEFGDGVVAVGFVSDIDREVQAKVRFWRGLRRRRTRGRGWARSRVGTRGLLR